VGQDLDSSHSHGHQIVEMVAIQQRIEVTLVVVVAETTVYSQQEEISQGRRLTTTLGRPGHRLHSVHTQSLE